MHGNSHENMNPYHLYAIDDIVEDDILKYGITDDPIGEDGLPERVRIQIGLFNIVANFIRFVGRTILSDIPGRAKAEEIENEYIDRYEQEHGRRPGEIHAVSQESLKSKYFSQSDRRMVGTKTELNPQ